MSTIYFATASLDGFLADQDGSLDWLFEVPRDLDPREEVGAFFSRVGAYAMGATTYQWMLDNLGVLEDPDEWRSWSDTVPAWVFTHRRLPPVPEIPIHFVEGDVRTVRLSLGSAARDASRPRGAHSPTLEPSASSPPMVDRIDDDTDRQTALRLRISSRMNRAAWRRGARPRRRLDPQATYQPSSATIWLLPRY